MPFDPETASDLKPWLVRTLEPICDAEPGALADYILALLKHNAPEAELRKELLSQLEEFLEKEGPPFVDTLFTALRTKSYLPYSATSPSSSSSRQIDTGIPIPLDALMSPGVSTSPERSRKRSLEPDDHELRPVKTSRLNHDGQFSRYGRGDSRSSWGGRGDRGGRPNGRGDYMDGAMHPSMAMGMGSGGMGGQGGRGIQSYQPPDQRRGICRDYYNNGYCARGAYCKYSHGEDAVIPSQLFPMNGPMGVGPMPFVPMMPNGGMPFGMAGGAGAAYDPHERIDMRPMGASPSGSRPINPRAPIIPRQADTSSPISQKPGELPVIQDLTPQGSSEDGPSRHSVPLDGYNGPDMEAVAGPSNGDVMMNRMNIMSNIPQDVEMTNVMPSPQYNGRGSHRGHMHRGGRGHFAGEAPNFRSEKRNDKTLVVEKIPEDKLSLGAVNEWFKRFGTVTNVAVDVTGAKALVSFSNHEEALVAWKSEDAVFNNRFVKVFWHRPLEGHGQAGARMLAASAPLVANISGKEATAAGSTPTAEPSSQQASAPVITPARKPSTSSAAAALAAKQRVLEQQIAEQKSLMTQLATASPQEKKDIMARLRKLGEEMKPSPSASPAPPAPATTPTPASAQKSRGPTPRPEDKERLVRERLDKELELHHAASAAEGDAEESTEELKATLAKLKAEAASLGLSEASDTSYSGTTYRPYRGRARGRGPRGAFRGAMRGGPPRGSMKLDLRPKKFLVKGASADAVLPVRKWYESAGQVESVDVSESGDVIVSFKSRAAAEQGLSKGTNIPQVGQVQISWFTQQQTDTIPPKTSLMAVDEPAVKDAKVTAAERPVSPSGEADDVQLQEEPSATGWGGDDAEDGFGML